MKNTVLDDLDVMTYCANNYGYWGPNEDILGILRGMAFERQKADRTQFEAQWKHMLPFPDGVPETWRSFPEAIERWADKLDEANMTLTNNIASSDIVERLAGMAKQMEDWT